MQALPTANAAALAIAVLTIGCILAVRRYRPHWPGFIIAVALARARGGVLGLPVETIGTRFGGIPHSLPPPHVPALSWEGDRGAAAALSFALLGCIECLLSAVVADA